MARRSWSRVTRRRCCLAKSKPRYSAGIGGIGGRPEEADRLAVGREPQVERRAPLPFSSRRWLVRVADILDEDRLGMSAREGQAVARWAERRARRTRPRTRSRRIRPPSGIARSSTSVENGERIDRVGPVALDADSQAGAVGRDRQELDGALGRDRREPAAGRPASRLRRSNRQRFPPSEPTKTSGRPGLMATVFSGSRPDRSGILDSARDVPDADRARRPRRWPGAGRPG